MLNPRKDDRPALSGVFPQRNINPTPLRIDDGGLVLEDLLQGMNEWRNIQDSIRSTVKTLHDIIKAQDDKVKTLELQMESKASISDLQVWSLFTIALLSCCTDLHCCGALLADCALHSQGEQRAESHEYSSCCLMRPLPPSLSRPPCRRPRSPLGFVVSPEDICQDPLVLLDASAVVPSRRPWSPTADWRAGGPEGGARASAKSRRFGSSRIAGPGGVPVRVGRTQGRR